MIDNKEELLSIRNEFIKVSDLYIQAEWKRIKLETVGKLNNKKNMVLMTSIAVMAGMLPQLWSADGMKTAMAAVLIGGMLASLIWTFTLTPALFFAMERLRQRLKK